MKAATDKMFRKHLGSRSKPWRRSGPHRAGATLALLLGLCVCTPVRKGFAQISGLETLIQVLFQDLPMSDGVDANGDGGLTVADVVALAVPAVPTPTPTPVGLLFSGVISDLVPHAVGDQLVYRVTDPTGAVSTETTTATSSDPGGAFVIDDLEVDDAHSNVIKHETQSYTDTGTQLLFQGFTDQTTSVTTTCTPPLLRMVMPLIAGQSFSTTIDCDLSLNGSFFATVHRTDAFTPVEIVDSLTVPAGTFTHLIHISGSTDVEGAGHEADEIYFAIGVGPILDVATTNNVDFTRTELISGTIGGVPVGQ